MKNHNEISEFIWGIKEHIRDEYAEKDYEEVILPFTLLRRIDCVLEGTNEKVVQAYEKYKDTAEPELLDRLLKKASGHNFYNRSHYSLLKITTMRNVCHVSYKKICFNRKISEIIPA